MLDSSIFKVNRLSNKNQIETIYVFFGLEFSEENEEETDEDLNKLFKKDPKNKLFANVFDKDELDYIKKEKIDVSFVNQTIYVDDNIGTIKLKIFEAIEREVSMSEMYLFCLNYEILNPITVYQKLTYYNRLALTKPRLNQLLLNLHDKNGVMVDFKDKEQYTFDDIIELRLNESTYLVSKPLGQKVNSDDYPFVSNPFLAIEHNSLPENFNAENKLLSNNLLLDTGVLFKNNIYLCLAKDIFENLEENPDKSKLVSRVYFPFLYYDNIENIETLNDNRKKLIKYTSEKITADTKKIFNNINLFHQIYKNHSPSNIFSQNAKQTGITYFKANMRPEFKVHIPIDVIFKLIHATKDVPLLKYNLEKGNEKMYRLYAPKLTSDGQKIPYLEKSLIFKLKRFIGKTRCIAIYTVIQYNNTTLNIICEFYDDSSIIVYPFTVFETPVGLNNVDEIIKMAVNPLIEQIKPFFEQSGLEIPLFDTVQSPNVDVKEVTYQTIYKIKHEFNVKKKIGCISSVFTIESKDFQKNIVLRFKRVSNYNKRESQDAFIIEKIDQGYTKDDIEIELIQQFPDINEDDARELIANILSELGITGAKALRPNINPGFQTLMDVNKVESSLTVTVNGINNIQYLKTIPIYVDSIVRIMQDIDSCGVDPAKVNKLCSGKELKDLVFKEVAPIVDIYDGSDNTKFDESPVDYENMFFFGDGSEENTDENETK